MSNPVFNTAEEAELAFYRAFERGDLYAMMQVWHETDYIECIHPLGERLRGVQAVQHSWSLILEAAPDIHFNLLDSAVVQKDNLAIHTVCEDIRLGNEEQKRARMLATNIYEKTASGWKLILHHSSPIMADNDKDNAQQAPVLH